MAGASKVLVLDSNTESKLANGRFVIVNDAGLQIMFYGAATTRAAVLAEVGVIAAIGAQYQSSAGKLYIKVANAAAATDWQRVTATAAD